MILNSPLDDLSESFGKVPKASETFRKVRKESHTLTVKQVLKLFELKNVDITERSVVNYCHPNKHGIALLDCFYDNNEKKYYITPESVEKAIKEVAARKLSINKPQEPVSNDFPNLSESFGKFPNASESFGNVPKGSESFGNVPKGSENPQNSPYENRIKELEYQILDLKITNKGKDYFIDQLQKERKDLIKRVEDNALLVGELKTKLLQLEAPKQHKPENETEPTGQQILYGALDPEPVHPPKEQENQVDDDSQTPQ